MDDREHTKAALPSDRAYRRLVRNMRTARDLRDRLHGTEIQWRQGRPFRVIPGDLFSETCKFLRRIGGDS